jgi:hypothetical protein
MLLSSVTAALIGLATASLPAKLAQRHSDVWLEERQAYPYPAFTIDQIVCPKVLSPYSALPRLILGED